jgi:hypothetical protein
MGKQNHISLKDILSAVNGAMRSHGNKCLKPHYKKQKKPNSHYSFGLCYIASEAVFHLMKEFNHTNLKPMVGRVKNNTHWWLEDTITKKRIDPTKNQFETKSLRNSFYKAGKGCGFLTKKPSKRAQILINHAKKELKTAILFN